MAKRVSLGAASALFGAMNEAMVKAAHRGLYAAALKGVQIIQTQIIPSRTPQPVDKGLFRAGWKAGPITGGAFIENREPHAPFIEHGVRAENVKPGIAMIFSLALWVQRKGLADGPEALRRAYAIAYAAKRRGIFNGGQGFKILDELMKVHMAKIIREEVSAEISKVT